VEIDAFGQDDFVGVRIPEVIYQESIVRTDYESWAHLIIDGEQYTIGPNSETPIASFTNARRRDKSPGFFARVLREITRSLSPPEEEDIVAGGRASNVEPSGTSWVYDVDPNELFNDALDAIDDGDFEYAVESLRLIEYPSEGEFQIEEYYVNLSYALMGMGDFHAAMDSAFEYLMLDPSPDNAKLLPQRLQLLAGISAYYSGEPGVADAALQSYVERAGMEDAAPEAVVIMYLRLREMGRAGEATDLLSRARHAQPAVQWDELVRQ